MSADQDWALIRNLVASTINSFRNREAVTRGMASRESVAPGRWAQIADDYATKANALETALHRQEGAVAGLRHSADVADIEIETMRRNLCHQCAGDTENAVAEALAEAYPDEFGESNTDTARPAEARECEVGEDEAVEIARDVFVKGNELVVCGIPNEGHEGGDEETGHNCDAMGCGQAHVIARRPIVRHVITARQVSGGS